MRHFTKLLLALCLSGYGIVINAQNPVPVKGSNAQSQSSQQKATVETAKSSWTIGVLSGPSPFQLSTPKGVTNPVLRPTVVNDLNVDIVAHPFMVVTDKMYYVFFTAKFGATDKGGIGCAESKDGLEWKYRKIVLLEPFVTSYPYVFKWQNDYYMIPENHTETSIRLYKAVEFPDKWKYEGDLLSGETFISTTLARFKDMWWMFTSRSGNDNLRLFYSKDLKGPWTEHPMSPIVKKDLNIARPGGRPFVFEGNLYRLGQDCEPTYGNQVHAFKITDISTTTYSEEMIETPMVKSTSKGWNSDAMHHIDVQQTGKNKWSAVVDALGK